MSQTVAMDDHDSPSCTLANAAWHADPYPFYAALRARHRDSGPHRDADSGMWVACTAAAVQAALQAPALHVRPPDEPVPPPLQGRPIGQVFGGLMRMNEGASRHDLPKARALEALAALHKRTPACAEAVIDAGFTLDLRHVNDLLFDAPLALMAALLGVPMPDWSALAADVRSLVGAWSAHADEAQRQRGDTAALALLARFDGDANRIGFFTQACDATAGLVGLALTAWQRDAGTAIDADGLAALAQLDPPVQNTRRFAADELQLLGHTLQRGDAVLVLLASANHDAAHTDFGWGYGRHACPGERLSREIAAALLARWLHQDEPAWRAATARWRYRPLPNARIPHFTAQEPA